MREYALFTIHLYCIGHIGGKLFEDNFLSKHRPDERDQEARPLRRRQELHALRLRRQGRRDLDIAAQVSQVQSEYIVLQSILGTVLVLSEFLFRAGIQRNRK